MSCDTAPALARSFVLDKFRGRGELGAGGMGRVWSLSARPHDLGEATGDAYAVDLPLKETVARRPGRPSPPVVVASALVEGPGRQSGAHIGVGRARVHGRFLALSLFALAACGKSPATAIVVGISVEPRVPDQLDELTITFGRGDAASFSRAYRLPDPAAPLPGTLTAQVDDPDAGPVSLVVRGRDTKTGKTIERRARITASNERTKLLRVRLQYACIDRVCEPGTTCVDGACAPEAIDAAELPDFASNGDAVAPAGCFDESRCLADMQPQTLVACAFDTTAAPGTYNVAATWKGATGPAVLEPGVGYVVAAGRVIIASSICQSPLLEAIVSSTACAQKQTPVCALAPTGAAGTAGAAGAAGAGGKAGGGGAGQAGQSGKGGAGATGGSAGNAGKGGAAGAGGQSGSGGAGAGGAGAGGAGAGGAGAGGAGAGGAGAGGAGAGGAGAGGAGASGAGAGGAGAGGVAGQGGATGALAKEGWRTLDVGTFGVCAVKASGDLYCWGEDRKGIKFYPAGTPTGPSTIATAKKLPGVPPLRAVTVGNTYVCGIGTNGKVVCWGENTSGQLGRSDSLPDVGEVTLPAQAIDVRAVGERGACALLDDGTVHCWGTDSGNGELGLGLGGGVRPPTKLALPAADPAVQLAGLDNVCALLASGEVHCWGNGVAAPAKVASGADEVVVRLGVGLYVRTGAMITEYSSTNPAGLLVAYTGTPGSMLASNGGLCVHDTTTLKVICSKSPTSAGSFTSDVGLTGPLPKMASGTASNLYFSGASCAQAPSGEVKCWGDDATNMIGNGRVEDRWAPTLVPATSVKSLASSGFRMLAVQASGTDVLRWGLDGYDTPVRVSPKPSGLSGAWKQVFTGNYYDALLATDGTPTMLTVSDFGAPSGKWLQQAAPGFVGVYGSYTWTVGVAGDKVWGYTNDGVAQPEFAAGSKTWVSGETATVTLPEPAKSLAVGGSGACSIGASGKLYCWGCNAACADRFGPVGDLDTPTQVTTPGSETVVSVCMGYHSQCVVTQLGTVACRGSGEGGVLGDGTTNASSAWKTVATGLATKPTGVVCNGTFGCAWDVAGDVSCWGQSYVGELGRGVIAEGIYTPQPIGLSGVAEVVQGDFHACARREPGGEVLCWGFNTFGQLGIGVSGLYSVGQSVVGLPPGP